MSGELAKVETQLQRQDPLSVEQVKGQINLIQSIMKSVMQEGQHYGKIPGCGDKKALLKAGAEKLMFVFHMVPVFEVIEMQLERGHREYRINATVSNQSGCVIAQGVGCCSTMESKYRYRSAGRKCPACGSEAIIKGKAEYGGGWLCFEKKGGCGKKWPNGAAEIENQDVGKVENPDVADQYNTVLKMAKKRALVDAIITATATSDIFTQDVDENMENESEAPLAAKATPITRKPLPPDYEPWAKGEPPMPEPGQEEIVTHITNVTYKSGTSKGKNWTLYFIDTKDGKFLTFDKKHAESAKAAKELTDLTLIKWKPGRKEGDREVISIDAGDAPPEPGTNDE